MNFHIQGHSNWITQLISEYIFALFCSLKIIIIIWGKVTEVRMCHGIGQYVLGSQQWHSDPTFTKFLDSCMHFSPLFSNFSQQKLPPLFFPHLSKS